MTEDLQKSLKNPGQNSGPPENAYMNGSGTPASLSDNAANDNQPASVKIEYSFSSGKATAYTPFDAARNKMRLALMELRQATREIGERLLPNALKSRSDKNTGIVGYRYIDMDERKNPTFVEKRALTRKFAKAAGHIDANLVPLSQSEISRLRSSADERIRQRAGEVIQDGDDPELVTALTDYVEAVFMRRGKVKTPELEEWREKGVEAIRSEVDRKKHCFHELERELAKEYNFDRVNPRHGIVPDPGDRGAAFLDSDGRAYFRLHDRSISSVRPFVEAFLKTKGYEIIDYKGGYATNDDGKNKRRINKILKSFEDTPPGLCAAFRDDFTRVASDMLVVLTRDPVDIARGSYLRGWSSCRSSFSAAARDGIEEYEAGVFAAYLIKKDDPEIYDPLARIFFKPYEKRQGAQIQEVAYFGFTPIGMHHPGFAHAVNDFVDTVFNHGLVGEFCLNDKCEAFREYRRRTALPERPADVLKYLGIKHTVEKGKVALTDTRLDLSDMGLWRLPDLSDVQVAKGLQLDIDVSDNKLVSLAGLPQKNVGDLHAGKGNLISSFHGCPENVQGVMRYDLAPYLLSPAGVPKAKYYRYGNDRFRPPITSRWPHNPIDDPESFQGFVRPKS
mgnify:CR=1 FL=1